MNNKQVEILKKKINKFANLANLYAWNGSVRMRIEHRFSLRKSVINFNTHYLQIPHPNEFFIIAGNNDIVVFTIRDVREFEDWQIDPNSIYEQVVGDAALYALNWEVVEAVPTKLVNSIMGLFREYYGTTIDYPVMTIAIPSRVPHEIYNKGVIYLPNSSLFPEEFTWTLKMQRARIDGREVPPRPEVLLGERLRHEGLYDGIEWEGAE